MPYDRIIIGGGGIVGLAEIYMTDCLICEDRED